MTAGPRLSVVVPTRGRAQLLERCLDALAAQTLEPAAFEVLVVDDGHSDTTAAQVQARAAKLPPGHLRYLRPAHGTGPAAARNTGWRAALGAVIAFTDDDTVAQPDWLAEGEQALLGHPGWVGLAGRVAVPHPPDQPLTDHARMTQGLETAMFVTANAFVRRKALARVQGFDERFQRPWREDADLQFRLAALGPVRRGEQAVVWHPVRPERWGVSLRQQRNVFFDALLYRKHPRLYRACLRRTPPWHYYGIVALALATPALALAWPLAAAAAATAAGGLVLRFAAQRLHHTSRAPWHVLEMLATSALIPFLSVYWRLRGALHFRVWFL